MIEKKPKSKKNHRATSKFTIDYIQCAKDARSGDADAAREMLDQFCCEYQEMADNPSALEKSPISPRLLEFLFVGFDRYLLNGEPLEKALFLKLPPGKRQRAASNLDPHVLLSKYYLLRKSKPHRKSARSEIMRQYGLSLRTFERLDTANPEVRTFTDERLKWFAEQPVRIKAKTK